MTKEEADDIRKVLLDINSADENVSEAAMAKLATNASAWLREACDEVERDLKSITSLNARVFELEGRVAEATQAGTAAPNAMVVRANTALNHRNSVLIVVLDAARRVLVAHEQLKGASCDDEHFASMPGLDLTVASLAVAIKAADVQAGK